MLSKGKGRIKLFIIIFLLLTFSLALAQGTNNLSSSDLSNVNIDELSDEQIQSFLNKAQEFGLTLNQLEFAAKQRGVSDLQITKLRRRMKQLDINQEGDLISSSQNRLRERIGNEKKDDYQLDDYQLFDYLNRLDITETDELSIFGLNMFKFSDVSFESSLNVATPENYILGAGDEMIIDVYGASEITYQQVISPDGTILISGIGPISLSGLTIKESRRRIYNKLSNIYSNLKSSNPNTFLQISIGQIKSIKVNVVGHVVRPGSYTLSSFSSAFNALYFAGGPTESGSMRKINIMRNDKKVATLDVYEYLFNGNNSENPQLQDQDIIIVKPYINRVKLAGNVKYSAIYELKKDESITDLLKISGGYIGEGYKKSLTIDRAGEEQREVTTVFQEYFDKTTLMDGDSIYIPKISNNYLNRVKVEGAVIREGYFEITDDLTLSKLISLAGGLREDAYLKHGHIIRLTTNLRLTNVTFDLNEVINGKQDFVLNPNDIVRIFSIFQLEGNQVISLMGEVRRPGEYPFIDSMTVEDIINIAGGLTKKASSTTIEVARRISNNSNIRKPIEIFTFSLPSLKMSDETSQFFLKPFDLVMVKASSLKQTQKVIEVEGEVKYPGYYALKSNEDRISDLIKRAGGLTEYGYAEGASLIRRAEYGKEELKILLEKKKKNSSELGLIEQQGIGIELEKILRSPGSEYDLMLNDGDLLSVPKQLETVKIQGEILFPNTVRYIRGMNLKKYISQSGGFSDRARKGQSYVIYANGSVQRTKKFLWFKIYPSINPGADIIVPKKEPNRRISLQEVISVTSSLATVILVIKGLTN